MAPVGHASAAGRASLQRSKSNSGHPRNCSARWGATRGYPAVAEPTLNVFWRILNIALPIRPRIGQVEALVDHWKIRNDIAFHRFHDCGPVVDGWIFHFAAFEAIAVAGSNPVNDLATPPFHRAQRAPIRRNALNGGAVRTVRQTGSRSADD